MQVEEENSEEPFEDPEMMIAVVNEYSYEEVSESGRNFREDNR